MTWIVVCGGLWFTVFIFMKGFVSYLKQIKNDGWPAVITITALYCLTHIALFNAIYYVALIFNTAT